MQHTPLSLTRALTHPHRHADVLKDVQSLEHKAEDALAAGRRVVEVAKFLEALPGAIKDLAENEKKSILEDVQRLKDLLEDLKKCIANFGKKGEVRVRSSSTRANFPV